MSEHSALGFGQFIPGFDFLQKLTPAAASASATGSAIPGMSSWIAPTVSVEELDKRIQELKTVQFWLEQNGTALKATIQALEVQKMTLSTLQSMNVSMNDLAKAFTVRPPETPPAADAVTAAGPTPEPTAQAQATVAPETKARPQRRGQAKSAASTPAVDPMAWWGSLTQQFQNIASAAMKDVAAQALQSKGDARESVAASRSAPQAAARSTVSASARKSGANTRAPGKTKPGASSARRKT